MLPCPFYRGGGEGVPKEEPSLLLPGRFPKILPSSWNLPFCSLFPYNWTVQLPTNAVHPADIIPVSPLDTATDSTHNDEKCLKKERKKEKHTSLGHVQISLITTPPTMQGNSYLDFIRYIRSSRDD